MSPLSSATAMNRPAAPVVVDLHPASASKPLTASEARSTIGW
jgi:hypothetical protein